MKALEKFTTSLLQSAYPFSFPLHYVRTQLSCALIVQNPVISSLCPQHLLGCLRVTSAAPVSRRLEPSRLRAEQPTGVSTADR